MDHLYCLFIILINILISAVQIHSKESVVPIDALTEESCLKKRVGCCETATIEDKTTAIKCIALMSSDFSRLDGQDVNFLLKVLTCIMECIYKKSRFIGKKDTLNMKMVKLKAEELFSVRRQQDYYIHAHKACVVTAKEYYEQLMRTPATKSLFKNTCRPIFAFIQNCVMRYHILNDCPYFRWYADDISGHAKDCKHASERCFEIVD